MVRRDAVQASRCRPARERASEFSVRTRNTGAWVLSVQVHPDLRQVESSVPGRGIQPIQHSNLQSARCDRLVRRKRRWPTRQRCRSHQQHHARFYAAPNPARSEADLLSSITNPTGSAQGGGSQPPWAFDAPSMSFSSVSVIANALRLRTTKLGNPHER